MIVGGRGRLSSWKQIKCWLLLLSLKSLCRSLVRPNVMSIVIIVQVATFQINTPSLAHVSTSERLAIDSQIRSFIVLLPSRSNESAVQCTLSLFQKQSPKTAASYPYLPTCHHSLSLLLSPSPLSSCRLLTSSFALSDSCLPMGGFLWWIVKSGNQYGDRYYARTHPQAVNTSDH